MAQLLTNWKENFDNQFAWQFTFIPQIEIILAKYFGINYETDTIEIASKHDDMVYGIDISVKKKSKSGVVTIHDIGLRTRRMEEYEKYNQEFTVRYPSEYDKIFKGYLDYELYSFGDDNGNILKYTIIDLSVLRQPKYLDYINDVKIMANVNDSTTFKAFEYSKFASELILDTRTRTPAIEQTLKEMKIKSAADIKAAIIKTREKLAV